MNLADAHLLGERAGTGECEVFICGGHPRTIA
jgi:hypothetical protein